jgi:hypothetical protein
MKKISIAAFLFLTVIGSSYANGATRTTFANDVIGISHVISYKDLPEFKGAKNFIENFPGATNVEYKTTGLFTKVDFIWKALKLEAFYDKDGVLIATGRLIPFGNLPLAVQMNVNKEYADFVPTQVSELNDTTDGLCYYVTVAGLQKSYVLCVSPNGSISVFKKMKN